MKRFGTILLFLCGALAIFAAGRQNAPLLELRREYHLDWGEPLENSPPLVSFTTVALGGFRGIIADLLWLRSSKLQEEKKYFELVQLADWITKLEPRFALVWAFHGWNMAYNISVLLDSEVDRWRWVKHGFELMRDEGLLYNPGDPRLYRELGWIFQHKMAGTLDQAHTYYKRAWADEMSKLFDGPQPDYAYALAHPDDPRVKTMREQYKLLPQVMQEVDARYGPLDWRLPQAHAVYWAWRGMPYATGFDKIQLERMIFQSMQDAFWQGRAIIDKDENVFTAGPNIALLPRVRRAYEEAVAANPDESSIKSGHKNFLKAAMVLLYENHQVSLAKEVFEDLKARDPGGVGGLAFEPYVRREFTETVTQMNQQQALALVDAMLYQSCMWLAIGESDRSAGTSQLARLFYNRYMESRSDPKLKDRTGLPPFEQMQQEALKRCQESVHSAAARERLEKSRQPTVP